MLQVRQMVNGQYVTQDNVFNDIGEVMDLYLDDDLNIVVDPSSFLKFEVNGQIYEIEVSME